MMEKILFFDTETTGMPVWGEPSGGENQPHMVQLAAILIDAKTKEALEVMDVIIKPDGWVIPDDVTAIHGITNEQATDEGVPEKEALSQFMDMVGKSHLRVAHNTTFDNRIIRIALKRYMPDRIPDDLWKSKDMYYCTYINFRKLIGGKSGHKLEEAYKHFTGNDLENAHSAMADTKACMAVYWGLNKK